MNEFKNWQNRVLEILVFFDLFDYVLTLEEIVFFLGDINISGKNIQNFCKNNKDISSYDNFFYLNKRKNLIPKRLKQEKLKKKMWRKVKFAQKLISFLPFINSVFVCNNLALGSFDEKSDIDLLIVSKNNRLFLARFFITSIFHLFGLRRHGRKIAGKFCLSFYISENELDLGKIKNSHDIYLAFWMKTLHSIFDLNDISTKLFKKNEYWLKDYFYDLKRHELKIEILKIKSFFRKFMEALLSGKFGNKIENFLKEWQMKRAFEKKEQLKNTSGTIISKNMLKFHDFDKRAEIQRKFENKLSQLKI
ncbi:MAG: hypothetical protein UR27_C0001G0008 [Candidatus Peregrinibacteria bacterium GW2011_GWA2_33_10]|nr:MAG: hypothetical protein UR27_C0001G0008 [Candidatus Peregrinibacteria bacterium GW2011_GWA2_33_10]KKP39739.1 MAG: hypothetical protein UR30_C0008G0008 [Candidatus Peregrinibacteria bacterium GW2011_GWC2_33_13]OGJ50428.1 MAG: hypothetical protein A2229_02395 [Candidatus Peregrinibacteria bacterium RIFOXYA2_FULL_33_7]